jgi:hypothetical protein
MVSSGEQQEDRGAEHATTTSHGLHRLALEGGGARQAQGPASAVGIIDTFDPADSGAGCWTRAQLLLLLLDPSWIHNQLDLTLPCVNLCEQVRNALVNSNRCVHLIL